MYAKETLYQIPDVTPEELMTIIYALKKRGDLAPANNNPYTPLADKVERAILLKE